VARRCAANRSRVLRDERGFTLIEVMVAALVLVLGIGAVFFGFVGPLKLSKTAERENEAAVIAEGDIESIAGRPWAGIVLSSNNAKVSDPNPNSPSDPRYFVGMDTEATPQPGYEILENYQNASAGSPADVTSQGISTNGVEPFVPASATSLLAPSSPTPTGGPPGTIYRFITYRTELCSPTIEPTNTTTDPLGIIGDLVQPVLNTLFGTIQQLASNACGMHNIEKRITVAVVLTPGVTGVGPSTPVYVSTLVPNPSYGGAQTGGVKSCGNSGVLPVVCTLLGNLLGL
jgi:prepilin-type N-terminal cleavage/methylation domain-containing protein